MAIIKCKNCGGDMELSADKTYGTCEYCGSVMTLPRVDDEVRAAAFNRGNHFRRIGEFDKALAVYERIVREDENDAEAHWCCALCRFGIEYVEDPGTYEYLPTCHRASFDSFLEDVDYLAAVEHSDGITRRQYQKEAAKIAEVQKGILATSQNEEPFDVFICYKETDADGNRTKDSVLAQEIYYQLTQEGYRVFFSRITLEDKAGTQYEPYIFAALNSAKVMVALGTSEQNFGAVWVKNEWSRFLALMKKDRNKLLLPCYRDMDPYDLPEQLSVLQSYDMGKIGFMQDLTRGISKVLDAEKQPESVRETVVVQNEGGANMNALLKRGNMALEDQEWEKADEFFDRVLDMDAEYAEAYFGKYLAAVWLRNMADFRARNCANWKTEFDMQVVLAEGWREEREDSWAKYRVPGYLSEADISEIYKSAAASCQQQLKYVQKKIAENRKAREEDRLLTRALSFARGDFAKALQDTLKEISAWEDQKLAQTEAADRQAVEEATEAARAKLKEAREEVVRRYEEATRRKEAQYQQVCRDMEAATAIADYQAVMGKLGEFIDYQDSQSRIDQCKKRINELEAEAEEAQRNKRYQALCQEMDAASSVADYWNLAQKFQSYGDYKDCQKRANQCREKKAELAAEEKRIAEEAARQAALREAKHKKKVQRITCIGIAVAVLIVTVAMVMNLVVIPGRKYAEADALRQAGQTYEAAVQFYALGNYKDSRKQSFDLWGKITHRDTISAGFGHSVALNESGTVVAVGDNEYGRRQVGGWEDIVAVSAGKVHTVGLKADGTVVATDASRDLNYEGQSNVGGWTDIVAIAAGHLHTVGLKADGTVVTAGWYKGNRQAVSAWRDIVAIAAGKSHIVGLTKNGTVVSTIDQKEVSTWTDVVAIAAGEDFTVGLKADGTVYTTYGYQNDVKDWKDIVAIAADGHIVGVKADGTVVATGYNSFGATFVNPWRDIVAVEAGHNHTLGLRSNGTVVATSYTEDWGYEGQCDVSHWISIKLPQN